MKDTLSKLQQLPQISGLVEHGAKRGKQMKIPTINLVLPTDSTLELGVYASYTLIGQKIYSGVTHVGPASTFQEYENKAETFIFDFAETIYGQKVVVFLLKKLRDTQKFETETELKAQITDDIQQAKAALEEFQKLALDN